MTADKGGKKMASLSVRKRTVLIVVACLSVVLIGISVYALMSPATQSAIAGSGLLQTVNTEAANNASNGTVDAEGTGADSLAGTEGSSDSTNAGSTVTGSTADGGASGSSTSSASSSGDGADSSDSSTSADSSSGSSSSSTTAAMQVSISISSDAAGSPVSYDSTVSLAQGATVYDALVATGVSFNANTTAYGKYVSSIGGLVEKEVSSTSGWVYSVNGAEPSASCSSYVLHDGDRVSWDYTA